ncbi:MAG: ribosome-associated translation inhibitor RaiA [Flavobacteriaceae bacterium]|nr:ribosome-associated translation inhibitor RaiA [Flavobacteriaceae bacterium]
MNINFEYDHVKASERLEELTTKKLDKLESHYDFIVAADVYFKTENTTEVDTGMICGIRLNIKGSTLFAESSNGSFEASIHEVTDELNRQLRKKKDMMKSY